MYKGKKDLRCDFICVGFGEGFWDVKAEKKCTRVGVHDRGGKVAKGERVCVRVDC